MSRPFGDASRELAGKELISFRLPADILLGLGGLSRQGAVRDAPGFDSGAR